MNFYDGFTRMYNLIYTNALILCSVYFSTCIGEHEEALYIFT